MKIKQPAPLMPLPFLQSLLSSSLSSWILLISCAQTSLLLLFSFLASAKAFRSAVSLVPIVERTISAALSSNRRAPVSSAAARARLVLPVPGGPYSKTDEPSTDIDDIDDDDDDNRGLM
jgi:hypothetical protein